MSDQAKRNAIERFNRTLNEIKKPVTVLLQILPSDVTQEYDAYLECDVQTILSSSSVQVETNDSTDPSYIMEQLKVLQEQIEDLQEAVDEIALHFKESDLNHVNAEEIEVHFITILNRIKPDVLYHVNLLCARKQLPQSAIPNEWRLQEDQCLYVMIFPETYSLVSQYMTDQQRSYCQYLVRNADSMVKADLGSADTGVQEDPTTMVDSDLHSDLKTSSPHMDESTTSKEGFDSILDAPVNCSTSCLVPLTDHSRHDDLLVSPLVKEESAVHDELFDYTLVPFGDSEADDNTGKNICVFRMIMKIRFVILTPTQILIYLLPRQTSLILVRKLMVPSLIRIRFSMMIFNVKIRVSTVSHSHIPTLVG